MQCSAAKSQPQLAADLSQHNAVNGSHAVCGGATELENYDFGWSLGYDIVTGDRYLEARGLSISLWKVTFFWYDVFLFRLCLLFFVFRRFFSDGLSWYCDGILDSNFVID